MLFAVISLITVGISYGVARAQADEVTYQTTRVTKEEITDEEKQELVDAAAAAAAENVADQETVDPQLEDHQDLQGQIQAMTDRIAQLEAELGQDDQDAASQGGSSQIANLLNQNEELAGEVRDLQGALAQEQETTSELARRLAELEQKLSSFDHASQPTDG